MIAALSPLTNTSHLSRHDANALTDLTSQLTKVIRTNLFHCPALHAAFLAAGGTSLSEGSPVSRQYAAALSDQCLLLFLMLVHFIDRAASHRSDDLATHPSRNNEHNEDCCLPYVRGVFLLPSPTSVKSAGGRLRSSRAVLQRFPTLKEMPCDI